MEGSCEKLAAHHTNGTGQDDEPTEGDQPAWFDPHLLGRVLRHLLENVASHTPPGSRVTLIANEAMTAWISMSKTTGPA